SRFLRRLDDADREAILDRPERVEGLDLDIQVHAGRREAVDADHRRVADRLQDACVSLCHGGSPWLSGIRMVRSPWTLSKGTILSWKTPFRPAITCSSRATAPSSRSPSTAPRRATR